MKPIFVVSPMHTFLDLGSALHLVFRALVAFQVSQLSNCLSVFFVCFVPACSSEVPSAHARAKCRQEMTSSVIFIGSVYMQHTRGYKIPYFSKTVDFLFFFFNGSFLTGSSVRLC